MAKKQSVPSSFNYSDEWFTPKKVVESMVLFSGLLDLVKLNLEQGKMTKVLLPFDSSESQFYKYLKDVEGVVIIHEITDFLSSGSYEYDFLITNPPFSQKNEVISKCLEYNKPFCLVMPIETLGSQKRNHIYVKHRPPNKVFIPKARIEFLNKDGKKRDSVNFHSIFMLWEDLEAPNINCDLIFDFGQFEINLDKL